MTGRDRLLILPALEAEPSAGGGFVLTRKFIDGVGQYVQHWPGPVHVMVDRAAAPDSNLDRVAVTQADVPFTLQWRSSDRLGDDIANGSVGLVLASLVDKNTDIAALCRDSDAPCVYISEYSVLTRRQIIRTETRNPVLRWRRERWTVQLERRYQTAVRLAAGVQCNGTPTFEAYRTINRHPLLFFDTRVRAEHLATAETLKQRAAHLLSGQTLRLAFSGRLIAMKGADHLPLVAAELKRLKVPFTFDICGGGALEESIRGRISRDGLASQVRLRGVLDFQSQLLPFIAREVDLFVCCHRQGDPSCTYLETMSCGTPIVGYANEAFDGLTRYAGTGWVTPLDDPVAMARQIAKLNGDREALARAAFDSLAFASQHTFEQTMRTRITHMRDCAARLPRPAEVEGVGA